jgi:hypothetical protein
MLRLVMTLPLALAMPVDHRAERQAMVRMLHATTCVLVLLVWRVESILSSELLSQMRELITAPLPPRRPRPPFFPSLPAVPAPVS